MICPSCGFDNLPGRDECARCLLPLCQLDLPTGQDRVEASLMNDRVESLLTVPPTLLPCTTTVGQAMTVMIDREVEAVLLIDDAGCLVGILTERDLLNKFAGIEPSRFHEPVTVLMTRNPETIAPTDSLAFALHKMDVGGYRHLPVVIDGKPIGMITVFEIVRHVSQLCRHSG